MKKPLEIGTVLEGKIYTVPTFTNLYGKKVNGSNATIKLYHRSLTVDNHGIEPLSLLGVLAKHLVQESSLNTEEYKALDHILEAIKLLKLNG